MDNVILDGQVKVDKVGRIGVVGVDAPYLRRRQDHILRFFLQKELAHRKLIGQIEFVNFRSQQIGITLTI